jgi:hypothetical protein
VTATSEADTTKSASTSLTVTSDITVSVQMSPSSSSVQTNGTLQLTATISSNGKPDKTVTWSVNGVQNGNATLGTIAATGADTATYTAPATAPSPPSVTIQATSVADPSKYAKAQLTVEQGLAITSFSSSSPIPLTPLYISTSGLDTSATAAAVTVEFSDSAGFSAKEQPIRIATDGTVVAAAPLYVDPSSGQIGPGTVSVTLTQGSLSSAPISVDIQDLPPLSAYGTQLGDISRAVLNFDTMLLARRINQLHAFQALPGNTIDTSQAQATLNTLLTLVIKTRQDVDQVALGYSAVISNGTLPDGTPVQFDQSSLDLMDRISAVILTNTLGTLPPVSAASSAPLRSKRLAPIRHLEGLQPLARPRLIRGPTFGTSPRNGPSSVAKAEAQSSRLQTILQMMETATDTNEVTTAALESATGRNWVDQLEAASTAAGIYVDGLRETAFNKTLGAAAAIVSDIRLVGDCYGDLGAYIYGLATGNQSLVNTAVDAFNSIPRSELYGALYDFLKLTPVGEIEALQPVLTTVDFIKSVFELGQKAQEGTDSVESDLQASVPVPTVDTQGIGYVTGMVNVATNEGTGAPLSGIQLSSDLTDVFTTIADPSGNYQLFVPLQDPAFDYADATVTIIDPISQSNLGSEVVDLSTLTTAAPLQIPTLQGSPCNFIDFDGDDPDCD